jgi:hypothetical protein
VIDPAHFEGIYRRREVTTSDADVTADSSPIGRSLEIYAAAIGGDS